MLHALTSISADRRPKAPPTAAPAPSLHHKQHLNRARYIIRGEGKCFEGECFVSFVVCKSNHTKRYVHSPRSWILVRQHRRPQQRSHPVCPPKHHLDRARGIFRGEGKRFEGEKWLASITLQINLIPESTDTDFRLHAHLAIQQSQTAACPSHLTTKEWTRGNSNCEVEGKFDEMKMHHFSTWK